MFNWKTTASIILLVLVVVKEPKVNSEETDISLKLI